MIVQLSTGGRSGAGRERGGMLPLRPDMASLSVGSNNFPTRVYENPPDLVDWLASEMLAHDVKPEIEAFDLSHILKAAEMAGKGQLAGTPYVQFVMGVKNAMPADREVFDFYIKTVHRLFGEDAPWCAAGIGAQPDRPQRMGDRGGRACAHGAGGQCPPRPAPRWRPPTRRLSGGRWRSARSTSAPWRTGRRRGRCWA
jgi:hypothetical protein